MYQLVMVMAFCYYLLCLENMSKPCPSTALFSALVTPWEESGSKVFSPRVCHSGGQCTLNGFSSWKSKWRWGTQPGAGWRLLAIVVVLGFSVWLGCENSSFHHWCNWKERENMGFLEWTPPVKQGWALRKGYRRKRICRSAVSKVRVRGGGRRWRRWGEPSFSSFLSQKLDPYLPPSKKLDSEKANGWDKVRKRN